MIDVKSTLKFEMNPFEGRLTLTIGIDEIVSSHRIKLFGIEHRKCRFDSELTDTNWFKRIAYTENSCILECRIAAAIQMCNCRPFFYDIGKNIPFSLLFGLT